MEACHSRSNSASQSTTAAQTVALHSYAGKSIFITGVTGFVGKVVLEKLLRSVPKVERIYLLIRSNSRYPTAAERFQAEVATSTIFDVLKDEGEAEFAALCQRKLRFVSGELTAERFGLEESAFAELAAEIDLVVNCAASVNFREPLDDALATNTLSLYSIIQLTRARKVPLVHVSTCYVNGYNEGTIEETIAPPAQLSLPRNEAGFYDVEPLIASMQEKLATLSANISDQDQRQAALVELGIELSQQYGWNDTYTFTKWVGEQVLLQHLGGQALTILRPSIVESTLFDPVPGWIEGVKVADAIIMAYARQKVTFFPGDRQGVIDIIPADLVANSIIVAGAEALGGMPAHRVYQCSSSEQNPLTIKEVIEHVVYEARHHHTNYRKLFLRQPRRPFIMIPGWLFHLGLGMAYSAGACWQTLKGLLGAEASVALSNLDAARKLAGVFSFYTRPRYRFSNKKLLALASRLNDEERAAFPMDTAELDWQHYFRRVHLPGLNHYALDAKRARLKSAAQQRRPVATEVVKVTS